MKYKRYGEVAVESSLDMIKACIKKGLLTEEDHKQIMSAMPDFPEDNPFDALAQLIGNTVKLGLQPKDFYTLFDEYGQIVSEMKSTCLYADDVASMKLVDGDITLDVEFWKNFSGRFSLDHIAHVYNGDVRLCRTYAFKQANSRFLTFGFDEWSTSKCLPEQVRTDGLGFCNYGNLFFNVKTGTTFLQHVEDNLNTYELKLTNGQSTMCERISRSEFLQRIKDADYYFKHGVSYPAIDTASTTNFYLQISRMNMLEKAIKEYQRAVKSVERVRTEQGARKRSKEIGADASGLQVAKVSDEKVHSSYKNLSDIMVHKVYEKKPWQGGHHASPCKHTVSGHTRHYKNGKNVWIEPFSRGGKNQTSKGEEPEVSIKAIALDLKGEK